MVQAKPFEARDLAEEALRVARAQRDKAGQVAALHALGFALYTLGDPRALRTMRAAIRTAERHDMPDRAALVRRNLAMCLAYAGKARASIREIDAAQAALQGIEQARTEVFRISVYWLAGRGAEAVVGSTPALRVLRNKRDSVWEARVLYNRAAVLTLLGRHGHARADLERARELYTALGLDAAAADACIELARVRSEDGDYIGCLAELDRVDVSTLSEWAACWLYLCRADALIELRLLPEASEDLARFEARSRNAEAVDSLNQARLDGALLALASGDSATAAAMATSARRSFAARGQTTFSSQATLIVLAAATRDQSVSRSALRAGSKATRHLEADGRTLDALRGHLVLARAAAVRGYTRTANREIAAARPLDRRGAIVDRIELRYVQALQCLQRADARQAERRLRSGLDLLEAYRSTLGAADLRATASALGVDLSRLGVSIAGASRDPASLLAWAERLRGNALRAPPASISNDSRLRREQDELRTLDRTLQRAERNAKAARALGSRRADLETSVRTHARLLPGRTDTRRMKLDKEAATHALGDRALVEYVDLDGRLHAIVLSRRSLTLHDLGEVDVSADLEWLRFALRRLARGGLDANGRTTTLANAAAAAITLDRMLVAPLREAISDAPLVIVPTGPLHAVPWGALPSLHGRAISVAPSLSTWLDLATRPQSRRSSTTLIAGPHLRHARAEVKEIESLLPDAQVLTGKAATVEASLAALDGAGLAHVACHGRFRADSPLFSSLELADGPLTALDIQGLRRAPDVLVLSACDVALSERHPGDELLGLSAALLASGTRTIVASVVPVPDAAARRLMLAFHRRLDAGASPAAALAEAQAGLRGDRSALAGFLCLGVG
jgi:CHAT domain-containing protein